MSQHILLSGVVAGLMVGPAAAAPGEYLRKPDAWFASAEARQVAANILSYQSELGGWPKNVDTASRPYQGDRAGLRPTYDNGATTGELRFLARIYAVRQDATYRAAIHGGLDYVLDGQYRNGGWPQSHPPGQGYPRHITFNDGAMVRLMEFVREVATRNGYAFLDDGRRKRAAIAFDRGLACILRCQVQVEGKLTAWCAQHDEIDFRPQPARSFELATLSAFESAGIVRLLMSIREPSPEVVRAVEAAIAWLETAKLSGIRVTREKDARGPKGWNTVVVSDPAAPPQWARFYRIETNRPVFADRDGIPRPALADLGYERRNGYAWYGTWPQELLQVDYPTWRKRVAARTDREGG